GLVTGAQAMPVVAVEILIEERQIAPVGIAPEALEVAVDRPAPGRVAQEDRRKPSRQLARHVAERHQASRGRRALDLDPLAIEAAELPERLQEQIVDGKPDGSTPVRVAAEETRGGLAGFIAEAILAVAESKPVGVVPVDPRERADAVRRQE